MKSYSFLQEKELALGEAHGLDKKQMKVLSDPRLNYVQMGVLRKAMENGVPLKKAKQAARLRGSEEEMLAVMNRPEKKRKKLSRKLVRRFAGIAAVGVLTGGLTAAVPLVKRDALVLKSSQITLVGGDMFQPSRYVLSFPERDEVILPEAFRAQEPGERIAVYRTSSGDEKILRIIICDRTAPVLSVSADMYDGEDCLKAVIGAYDDTDGDLKRSVSCHAEGEEIVYSVADSSGNTAEERVKMTEEFKIEEINEDTPPV